MTQSGANLTRNFEYRVFAVESIIQIRNRKGVERSDFLSALDFNVGQYILGYKKPGNSHTMCRCEEALRRSNLPLSQKLRLLRKERSQRHKKSGVIARRLCDAHPCCIRRGVCASSIGKAISGYGRE